MLTLAPEPGKHFHLLAVVSKPMLQSFVESLGVAPLLSEAMSQKRKSTAAFPLFVNLHVCVTCPVFLSTFRDFFTVTPGSLKLGGFVLLPCEPSSLTSPVDRTVVCAP